MVNIKQDFRRLSPEEVNPLSGLVSKAMKGYYMPRQMNADIFHKTVSPLTNLAISPAFMLLNPKQRQQIADYIGSNLSGLMGGYGSSGSNGGHEEDQGFGGHPDSGGIPDVSNDYAVQTGNKFASEQTSPGVRVGTGNNTSLSPTSSLREQTANALVSKDAILKSLHNLQSSVGGVEKSSWFKHPLDKASLYLERFHPLAKALVPGNVVRGQNDLVSQLVKAGLYDKEGAESQVIKGGAESIPEFSKSLTKLEDSIKNRIENLRKNTSEGVKLGSAHDSESSNEDSDMRLSKDWSQQIKKAYNINLSETGIYNYIRKHNGHVSAKELIDHVGRV